MSMKRVLMMALVAVLVLAIVPTALMQDSAVETPVTFIELAGPAGERDAEISSLAWYGDYLLLMTENPFIYAEEGEIGRFFALEKGDIMDYLEAESPEPLEPWPVPLYGDDIMMTVGGYEVQFDGFEAAAFVTDLGYFVEDRVFLTIEADMVSDETMRGYLVSGSVMPGLSGITLDLENFISIPRQTDFNNMSYESLFVAGDKLVIVYEVNGAAANESSVAYTVDLQTGALDMIPFPAVEYRITDVTAHDENGVFWATNYFYVGEDFLAADNDPIFEEFGMGASQAEFDGFERLVAFQYGEDGITLANMAPIQLLMTEDSNGRNWEGIVRMDDMGFLVVTDRYPVTLLGFVPLVMGD